MLGAIAGDIIGSVYEGTGIKATDVELFDPNCRFTDDTVLSVAVADCILHGGEFRDYFVQYFRRYPHAGYGGSFLTWALDGGGAPYGSWGNGSAMRVGPVGFAYDSLDDVLAQAQRSAEPTHNHPEGVRGAQAVAAAVFLARTGSDKTEIRSYVEQTFSYDLSRSLDEIRPGYVFDGSCQGSVPESIIAFLDTDDYETAVREAIALGGDADTMACIAGAIAEAFYDGIPDWIADRVWDVLDEPLARVVREFLARRWHG